MLSTDPVRYFIMLVPEEFVALCEGPSAPSTPALEAFGLWAFLVTFRPFLRNRVILLYTDNIPFLQAYERCFVDGGTSSSSHALACALRHIACELILLSSVLHLEYVDTENNTADPPSRDNLQAMTKRLGSVGLSGPFSSATPPSLTIRDC